MSPINYGSTPVSRIYRGASTVNRVYRGTNLIYSADVGLTPDPNATTYFNSNFTTLNNMSAYAEFINADDPSRAAVVTSPTNTGRKVMRMASQTGFTHQSEWPRTAVLTSAFIKSLARGNTNDIYYNAVSFYLPNEFTTMSSTDWMTIISLAWGPPYTGSGSASIQLGPPSTSGGEHRMLLGGDQLPLGTVPKNQWVNLIIGFKFAYETEGGWISVWRKGGGTWNPVPVQGQNQFPYDPLILGGNDGWHTGTSNTANTSRITVYGSKAQTVYFGEHFVTNDYATAAQHYEP